MRNIVSVLHGLIEWPLKWDGGGGHAVYILVYKLHVIIMHCNNKICQGVWMVNVKELLSKVNVYYII